MQFSYFNWIRGSNALQLQGCIAKHILYRNNLEITLMRTAREKVSMQ